MYDDLRRVANTFADTDAQRLSRDIMELEGKVEYLSRASTTLAADFQGIIDEINSKRKYSLGPLGRFATRVVGRIRH